MFALSALVEAAAAPKRLIDLDMDPRRLPAEYRFPVPSTPAVPLPRKSPQLPDAFAEVGEAAPLLWAALSAPIHRVPLVAPPGERRAALVTGCVDDGGFVVAVAGLFVRPGPTRRSARELTAVSFESARDPDAVIDLLQKVWIDATPAARAAAGGPRILWLGGDPDRSVDGGSDEIGGLCAVFGADAEIVRDATRHVRQIAARVGSLPPECLVVWQPEAHGVESVVAAFRAAGEGEVVYLVEPAFEDALLELRWALGDLGLDGRSPSGSVQPDKQAPCDGEERFYIKHYGSKVGDRMIEVLDCGHAQWGSDQRRKAPRAYKGIIAGVGVAPTALFLCARCSKNRWRARF